MRDDDVSVFNLLNAGGDDGLQCDVELFLDKVINVHQRLLRARFVRQGLVFLLRQTSQMRLQRSHGVAHRHAHGTSLVERVHDLVQMVSERKRVLSISWYFKRLHDRAQDVQERTQALARALGLSTRVVERQTFHSRMRLHHGDAIF